MKVQEALEAAIKAMEMYIEGELCIAEGEELLELCKSALSDIGKCEPVINLNILKYTEHGVIPDDFKGQASGYRAGWNDCLSSVQYMFSQPIEKCEPVANQDKAVSHLWESIGRWSAYIASNGEQAELSPPSWLIDAVRKATSPQPIEKCEPVINLNILKYTEHGVIPDDFKGQASGYRAGWNDCLSSIQYMFSQPAEKCEPVGTLTINEYFEYGFSLPDTVSGYFTDVNYNEFARKIGIGIHKLYTSPQPRDWVDVPYEERRELYKSVAKGNIDGFADLLSARLKQLNTKG